MHIIISSEIELFLTITFLNSDGQQVNRPILVNL